MLIIFQNIVARDLPGGKRILMIKIRAQHINLSKAIKNIKTFTLYLSGLTQSYMLGSY